MCDGRRKNFQRLPTLLLVMVGLSFAILACGCVSVRYALAEDGSGGGSFDYGVVYGPNSAAGLSDFDDPRYLVQVYAPNKYDAALIALGYNPTSSSFTDDARAYLSNQTSGGAFYDFAQLFSNNNTDWGEEITTTPSLTPGINFDVTNMETALKVNNSIYGADNVWSAEYTTTQRVAAVTAVGLVLSGSIGGSGDVGVDTSGDYVILPARLINPSFSITGNGIIAGDTQITWSNLPNEVFIKLTRSQYNNLKPTGNGKTRIFVQLYTYESSGTNYHYYKQFILFAYKGNSSDITVTYPNNNSVDINVTDSSNVNGYILTSSSRLRMDVNYVISANIGSLTTQTVSNGVKNLPRIAYEVTLNSDDTVSGDDDNPTVPPTNWPEPPENPTVDPPSVPDPPTDDPIQQPTDTPIQPPNVWMPIAGTTDPTFTVDLQGILDALSAHCQHIRDNLDGNFAQLYNNMTDYWSRKYTNLKQFLDGQFGYIGDTIVDKTDDLMDYLEDLFEWLAEQFDFSVSGTGYNDNTVVSWLRKIYARLGGGTTIRPPDPVVDPKGIGDWLNQLLQNLVLDLLAIGQDVLADLVESFRELITKFPFSIPWDIAAILALLVAQPQAPVIEIPQYTYTGLTLVQVGSYRLDLSQWNSVMDIVRPMETILFAGWLAFKTDFFKGLLEMTKG